MHMVVVGHRETVLHDIFDVLFGRVEQLGNVLELFLFMVLVIEPIFNVLAIPLKDDKVGVKKQNDVFFHFLLIKSNGDWLSVFIGQGIAQESRLNHR